MPVFTINPLTDARWDELVNQHQHAGVFHSSRWLLALQRTYGYEPVAFSTCCPSEPLKNGLVCCKVESWITGRRLVSLPFSDHCDILADSPEQQGELLAHVCERVAHGGYAHAEIRSMTISKNEPLRAGNLKPSRAFHLHRLSLDAPLDSLFRNFHRNCIQRKIRRAEREALHYKRGSSELLRQFYDLMLRTRRRHCLPPQPLDWFRNIIDSMGDNLNIRLASKDDCPVAAILTLSHKTTVTYKYGCSDERYNALGGTAFLLWKTIQEAKDEGMHEFDLGRSELDQAGLVNFKDRLGAAKTILTYWRSPSVYGVDAVRSKWQIHLAKEIFSRVPDPIFAASGRFLYRHLG